MVDLTKVDISKLKQQIGKELVIEQDEDFGRIDDVEFISPVSIKLHLINAGQTIKITGALKGEMLLQCTRCLEPFNSKLQRDFKIELCEEKHKIESQEHKLEIDDLEKSFYQGQNIDLKEEIRQQIILSLPMKAVCSENCQGLCNHCGVNLNKITCRK